MTYTPWIIAALFCTLPLTASAQSMQPPTSQWTGNYNLPPVPQPHVAPPIQYQPTQQAPLPMAPTSPYQTPAPGMAPLIPLAPLPVPYSRY